MLTIKETIHNEEKEAYLFHRFDVVEAIAHSLYYSVNPKSDMCIPNCAYERAEKLFDDWFTKNEFHLKNTSKVLDLREVND